MESELRILLTILGSIVLCAVITDALLRIRRHRVKTRTLKSNFRDIQHDKAPVVPIAPRTPDAVMGPVQKTVVKPEVCMPTSEIIRLTLTAQPHAPFSGRSLYYLFQSQGLVHGEKNIFHRYDGETGRILFSVANAYEPGMFHLAEMESAQYKGITLFFIVSSQVMSLKAFNQMYQVATEVNHRLGGVIQDSARNVFTKQKALSMRSYIQDITDAGYHKTVA